MSATSELDQILAERAAQLALVARDDTNTTQTTEHLVFLQGELRFAVALAAVHTVLRGVPVTRVPCAPASVDRVFHAAGRVVAVVDPSVLLDKPASEARFQHVVVLRGAGEGLAVAAQVTVGIEAIDLAALADIDGAHAGAGAVVVGVAPCMTLVLSVEGLALRLVPKTTTVA